MRARSWRWLRVRILGLLKVPPMWVHNGEHLTPVPQTRLGYRLYPPGRE